MNRQLSTWIPGTPASFATRSEKTWKEQLLTCLSHSKYYHSSLELKFVLPETSLVYKGHDLDNLCDPVFSVLASSLGWFEGKQSNIDGWQAVKTIGNNTGLELRQVRRIEEKIPEKAIIFSDCYYGKIPHGALDPEIPRWLQKFDKLETSSNNIGISLVFVNHRRSIASLSDGMVKHVIDCLYPLYGGIGGRPNDHLISNLTIKRIQVPGIQQHIKVIMWDCEKVEKHKQKLKSFVAHLIDELYLINEYFNAYITLYNKQATDVDTLNHAHTFFIMVLHAFLHQFVIMLCRIYEDNSRNNPNTIPSLINYLECNGEYIISTKSELQKVLLECRSLLDSQSLNLKKLKTLRDKTLVHNDRKWIDGNIWQQTSPTIGGYRSLITVSHEILCIISKQLDLPTPILGMGVKSDIDWLINFLKDRLEKHTEIDALH
ncbi:MAG: hypothetical protein ACOX58_03035 [Christensenellales bacterium]|jgi:hypothetical protein